MKRYRVEDFSSDSKSSKFLGSRDPTPDSLKKYESQKKNVNFFREENIFKGFLNHHSEIAYN